MNKEDIEYYVFTYNIPVYKIKPPQDFCEYYQTHKDEIIVELDKENKLLKEKVNQLESTLNEIIDWKDKNGNRYIYQDSLGEDWYFYDLDVFDELGEILDKVGGSNV